MDECRLGVRYIGRDAAVDNETTVGNGVGPVDRVVTGTSVATSPAGRLSGQRRCSECAIASLLIQG